MLFCAVEFRETSINRSKIFPKLLKRPADIVARNRPPMQIDDQSLTLQANIFELSAIALPNVGVDDLLDRGWHVALQEKAAAAVKDSDGLGIYAN